MISIALKWFARILFAVAGLVFVLSLMVVALVTLVGVMLWSLVRGQKPKFDFTGLARARQYKSGFGRPQTHGEVVDAEVREIPAAPPVPLR